MSIQDVVADIKRQYFRTDLAIGKTVKHPEHGTVKIVSGCFWADNGGLSNHWEWVELVDGQPTGARHHGYGWM